MTIHAEDPFATPEHLRSPVRRLRGRLPSAVTLWTSAGPTGLTVSSALIGDGDPGRVLGLVDEESEFWESVSVVRRFAVTLLHEDDQQLADRFAGLLPAPGGLFVGVGWEYTDWGPVPVGHPTWAGCRLDDSRPFGWGLLLEGTIEHIAAGDGQPLVHHRGRYIRQAV